MSYRVATGNMMGPEKLGGRFSEKKMGKYEKFISANSDSLVPLDLSTSDQPAAFIDDDDPRSILNLAPEFLRDRMQQIPKDLFLLTEKELVKRLSDDGKSRRPDSRINLLRISFWDEYDRVQKNSLPRMDLARIIERVCSVNTFRNFFSNNDFFLLYLLTPPTNYILSIKECLLMGIERMRETLSASPVNENGSVNEKLADIQHRMFQTLDLRLHGAVTQRIDQRILTAEVSPDKLNGDTPLTLADIDKRIQELEAEKLRGALPPATVIVDLMRDTIKEAELVQTPAGETKDPTTGSVDED